MLEEFSFGFPILSYLIFLPLAGAAVLWLIEDEDLLKTTTLGITLVELALACLVLVRFVPDSAAMQFAEHARWMPALGIGYHLAVDGISVLFVGLTAFLTVLVVIYSWDTVRNQVRLYFMALLALETTTMGIFASIDLILFFVFWELMLIPSYFLIKLWGGGAERHYAALKYVLYTLLGSVFMLVGIALLDINYHQWAVTHHLDHVYSFDLLELLSVPIPLSQQILIFWLMFMGFAFKAPVFPFHTWLPDALVEGPIGMAVMLAGMKLGTYGFLRFTFPLLPDASKSEGVVSIVMVLALAAILYGAVVALIQSDFKRLLAFSSISHLGFVVVGLFALNFQGLQGSLLTMINLGFVGEFLILLGAFKAKWWYGAVAVTGVIFGAAYFLWYYERAMLGPLSKNISATIKDLHMREITIALSLSVMILWIGLYPSPFLRMMNGSIQALVDRLDRAKVASVDTVIHVPAK